MTHENEYHYNIVTMLELIWGKGFMAPGGSGNVTKMLHGWRRAANVFSILVAELEVPRSKWQKCMAPPLWVSTSKHR